MTKLVEFLASRLRSWLTFGDYGPRANRSMVLAWGSIGCFILVDLVWVQASSFVFASSNWDRIFKSSLIPLAMFIALLIISHRLRDKTDRVGVFLWELTRRADLLWRSLFVMAALSVSAITFSFLASGAALPLKDAWLADVDRNLGFDWIGLLDFANANPTLSWILVKSYHSTGAMLMGVYVWLSLTGRAERLAEFIAILCTSSIAVGAGMILVPAAGAYTYYNPPQELFSNFSVDAGMWHYKLLMALRTDASPVIDLAKTEGMVTFPSHPSIPYLGSLPPMHSGIRDG